MSISVKSGPSYQGHYLKDLPGAFGELKSSADLLDDAAALHERMKADGYVYLPGLLDPRRVNAARDAMIDKLDAAGLLDPAAPRSEAVVRPDIKLPDRTNMANGVPEIQSLLYDAEMMEFFEKFLGGPVRHLDYTWFRAGTADGNTSPHCDTVYMSRGTPNLYTAWTPLVDVPYELGGLMILEESHTRGDLLGDYWAMDVDAYCTNAPKPGETLSGKERWQRIDAAAWQRNRNGGAFDHDAVKLQQEFKQRWLSTEYKAGDLLFFGMHTLHASADNHTNRFRLSTDSRYQLASEPADERWVGPNPIGHSDKAKKGMIC